LKHQPATSFSVLRGDVDCSASDIDCSTAWRDVGCSTELRRPSQHNMGEVNCSTGDVSSGVVLACTACTMQAIYIQRYLRRLQNRRLQFQCWRYVDCSTANVHWSTLPGDGRYRASAGDVLFSTVGVQCCPALRLIE
jgi:hypothetical protein